MKKYEFEFNPLDYGFRPVSEFPELMDVGNTFIKITALGGKEFNRTVYWYQEATPNTIVGAIDDRWTIVSSSYDENRGQTQRPNRRVVYSGLISSDEFAKLLLMHLFGTTRNDSVVTWGAKRLKEDLLPTQQNKRQ